MKKRKASPLSLLSLSIVAAVALAITIWALATILQKWVSVDTKDNIPKHERVFIDTAVSSNELYVVESEGSSVGFVRRIYVKRMNDKYNNTFSVAVPDTFKVVPGQVVKISIIDFYYWDDQLSPSWMAQVRKD